MDDPDVDPGTSLATVFHKYYERGVSSTDFDFEKLAAMVQMFALVSRELVKTKLT